MSASTALTEAVEELYRVLDAPMPEKIDYCGHCVSDDEALPFTTVPRRHLTADQASVYYLNSSTVGDAPFQRYLLPRLLELVALGAFDDMESNYYLGLATAGWWAWPEKPAPAELDALRGYLAELFRQFLSGASDLRVEDLVERLGEVHDDLAPFLAELEQVPDKLADFVADWFVSSVQDDRIEAWLRDRPELLPLHRQ